MILYTCNKEIAGKELEMENEEMTRDEFKTLMEMVIMIVEGSKDKEEALEKLKSLTILKSKN